MKTTKNEDNLKNEDDLKIDDDIKNEDELKNEDNIKPSPHQKKKIFPPPLPLENYLNFFYDFAPWQPHHNLCLTKNDTRCLTRKWNCTW